jgi:hypothetical protein
MDEHERGDIKCCKGQSDRTTTRSGKDWTYLTLLVAPRSGRDAFTATDWRTDANSKNAFLSNSSGPFDIFQLSQHACLASCSPASWDMAWQKVSIITVSVGSSFVVPVKNDSGEQPG